MTHEPVEATSTTDGLPVAPSLASALRTVELPMRTARMDRRSLRACFLAVVLGMVAVGAAELLVHLISFVTRVCFFGEISFKPVALIDQPIAVWMIGIPVVGGLIVGLMARYGSRAIRGHGIPEAMEQVLTNQSKIPPRLTFLKPLSSAVAIGTGGPFGAEGPIIATGGALGSLIGQILSTTAGERKTLLAAGAAAGMAATFGSPVAATLLAVELLLFELRAVSLIPVALAACTAAAGRAMIDGGIHPFFVMSVPAQPTGAAIAAYVALGALIGVAAVGVTRAVYFVEDAFERLPIHWMWWPAIGGIAVGVVGFIEPRTLGVGYRNISDAMSTEPITSLLLWLCVLKFTSWCISLGSGTSGGTLAPLFTIGGALGAILGVLAAHWFPGAGIDPAVAALVGMAAMFAGASRALLASVVFAFETTLQPLGLLPLLGGCTAAYLASTLLMRTTIMTEKIERRGIRVPDEYSADFLSTVAVRDSASRPVVTRLADQTVAEVQRWLSSNEPGSQHQGFPVLDSNGVLKGVLTRRDLLAPGVTPDTRIGDLIHRPPVLIYDDCSLREAADHMVRHTVGRLPVVTRDAPFQIAGIISRSDLLAAHGRRLEDAHQPQRFIRLRMPWRQATNAPAARDEDSANAPPEDAHSPRA
ncbi:MAG: chloride channel protein [Planctomycetota bacterium]